MAACVQCAPEREWFLRKTMTSGTGFGKSRVANGRVTTGISKCNRREKAAGDQQSMGTDIKSKLNSKSNTRDRPVSRRAECI